MCTEQISTKPDDIICPEVAKINEHIRKIFSDNELEAEATISNFRIVQIEGVRKLNRERKQYSLQEIIAVGFKVNNERAV